MKETGTKIRKIKTFQKIKALKMKIKKIKIISIKINKIIMVIIMKKI